MSLSIARIGNYPTDHNFLFTIGKAVIRVHYNINCKISILAPEVWSVGQVMQHVISAHRLTLLAVLPRPSPVAQADPFPAPPVSAARGILALLLGHVTLGALPTGIAVTDPAAVEAVAAAKEGTDA